MAARSSFQRFVRRLAAACVLLLAATPVSAQDSLVVRAANPLDEARPDETVVLPWAGLAEHLPGLAAGRVRVHAAGTGQPVVAQAVDDDGDGGPDVLVFQASFWPGETKAFVVAAVVPEAAAPRVHVRHDDPRDDVAWENDRIAFRTYGQGVWALEDLVSSGIDVWLKRTRDLVVERWYADGHYHTDTGEGADFFKVGPTLGAGGTAVWRDERLFPAKNFKAYRILADGPVRTVFELEYEPWDAGGLTVSEVRRVTMDAGQPFFKLESTFRTDGGAPVPYAAGLVKRSGLVGTTSTAGPWAWVAGWGPVDRAGGGHGDLGTAVLVPQEHFAGTRETADHYVALATAAPDAPAVHYVGAAWTAGGDVDSVEDWWATLDAYARRLAAPIEVTAWQEGVAVALEP